MDGLEATRLVREREARKGGRVPIVALTAHAMKRDVGRCEEVGMDDFLAKPMRGDAVRAVIEKWVPSATAPVPIPEPDLEAEDEEHVSPLDMRGTLRRLEGDTQLLRIALEAFLETVTEQAGALAAAVDGQDVPALRRLAHGLKGGAAGIGAIALQAAAAELEQVALGDDPDQARALMERLDEALRELLPAVSAALETL
jgi:CheY-like chemotaxis protein